MTKGDIRRLLDQHGVQLTKSLGQCFLHDQNVVERIVDLGEVKDGEKILEVGPGLGPLTERLIARGGEVTVVEIDQRLVPVLRDRFSDVAGFELISDDAMVCVAESETDWRDWKMVANLPYSIGSPLLVELSRPGFGPKLMAVTLQKEVVERMASKPGTKSYGILTVLITVSYEVGDWFTVPPGCFFPEPRVDSASVALHRREKPLVSEEHFPTFKKLVKLGFSQRRKMMMKLLKQNWSPEVLEPAFEKAGVDFKARAETVTVEQFVQMTEALSV